MGEQVFSRNWVFMGDSLTEGVGSSRISYVTELAAQLRFVIGKVSGEKIAVHELRLQMVDPDRFDRFVRFNFAGYFNGDEEKSRHMLCLWNLAREGQMVDKDLDWMPFLRHLSPELVVVFRGSLESLVRPALLQNGLWPWWVPRAWRSYSAMDPRCYFSTTWWRNLKQVLMDALKQKVRLHLLRQEGGVSLMDAATLVSHYRTLVTYLRELNARVLMLGLLPVDGVLFPGSPERFATVNARLYELATSAGAEFFDWAARWSLLPKN